MADTVELKQMVMSFRVSELQVLLGFAGRNKTGRKQDLLQRALLLIQKGCSTPVQIKIRELYRRVTAPSQPQISMAPPPSAVRQQYRPPTATKETSQSHHTLLPTTVTDNKSLDFSMKLPTPPAHSNYPVLPDVKFKRLPFYDVLGELLKTCTLVPKNSNRFQEHYSVFHLTPGQAQDIALSRDLRPGSKLEYTVQVQLRFCLLETSCQQEDNFPPSICVRVNSKMAQLPNPIPTNKPGVEPKRPSRPVNITNICRISPTVSNHLNVSWAHDLGRNYCVGVFLVRKVTSEELLNRLRHTGIKHPDHSRALIKEKLRHDPDSEIATTSLRVSLMCPLGKMRIRTPCRAHTCNHLQCFDAATFLMMNEKKPTWICPVCDKTASFWNLFIDGLYTEICRECPSDCNDIQFGPDGEWKPLKSVKETVCVSSPGVVKVKDDPSEKKTAVKKPQPQVIDLTLDSSDGEDEDELETEPPAQRPRLGSNSSSSQGSVNVVPPTVNVPSDSSSDSGGDSPRRRRVPTTVTKTETSGQSVSSTATEQQNPTEKFTILEQSIRTSLNAISSSASSLSSGFAPKPPSAPTSSSLSAPTLPPMRLSRDSLTGSVSPPSFNIYEPNFDFFSMFQQDFENSSGPRLPPMPSMNHLGPNFDSLMSGISTPPPSSIAAAGTSLAPPAPVAPAMRPAAPITPPHPSVMMSTASSPDVISLD
ncbi:E3 SUMO-protein ligase PIAS2-like [Tubulanus polymorphus]|uniref:E3 SUMO-protein ligase PIAS2-like n=1 Tax=Tubulanus polymorphus TaxID=672921 RepID=UPI003DA33D6A